MTKVEYTIPKITRKTTAFQTLRATSRDVYSYLGYSGLVNAWHDKYPKAPNDYEWDSLFKYIDENDMELPAFAVLATIIAKPGSFRSMRSVFNSYNTRLWLQTLRAHCDTTELFSEVAETLLHLIKHQSDQEHRVYFSQTNIVKAFEAYEGYELDRETDASLEKKATTEARTKEAEVFHTLADRIRKFKQDKIDPTLWIVAKYKKCVEAFEDSIAISAIARINTLEPDLKELVAVTNDVWRPIREFLQISPSCEFVDGFIPRGWRPSVGDLNDPSKIQKINGLGFYFFADGTQRKGQSHHMHNSYLSIKCIPENFEAFKESWDDKRKLTNPPTWKDYEAYHMGDLRWTETGQSTTPGGLSVVWATR